MFGVAVQPFRISNNKGLFTKNVIKKRSPATAFPLDQQKSEII